MKTHRKMMYSTTHLVNKNKEPNEDSVEIHCYKRLRIMITLGLIIRKIIKKKKITEVILSFEGAKVQDGKGNKKLCTEAAHNLPRDVIINGISMWKYIEDPECDFHNRVKKQIYLSAASTVIVKKEANYIDSQWEKSGLLDIFKDFLYDCSIIEINSDNELVLLLQAANEFINGCKETLKKTEKNIEKRKYFISKKIEFDEIIKKYHEVINEYDYRERIKTWLNVYQLPQYK